MSDDMTPKQMRDKIDQLKEEAKEAARQKLELENENLKLTIAQMKEIAGLKAELKAKLGSGPSSSGISEPPLKRPRAEGSDIQSGGDMKKTLERLVQKIDELSKQNGEMAKQIDGMAKQIDENTNELQQLKKQSNQIRMISSACSNSMHTTPPFTEERIEEVKSPMEVDQGSETGNNKVD